MKRLNIRLKPKLTPVAQIPERVDEIIFKEPVRNDPPKIVHILCQPNVLPVVNDKPEKVGEFPFQEWELQWSYMYPRYVKNELRRCISQSIMVLFRETMTSLEMDKHMLWVRDLEQKIYELLFYDSDRYKDRLFYIVNNIISNNSLLGKYSVDQLTIMDHLSFIRGTELEKEYVNSTNSIMEQNNSLKNDNIYDSCIIKTGLTKCHKCRLTNVMHREQQTRSADEPMTIFYECLTKNCGKKWTQ